MTVECEQIRPNPYHEHFWVGDVYEHRPRRAISRADGAAFLSDERTVIPPKRGHAVAR